MNKLVSIIMSGGSGTRLWPISRSRFPKPFIEVSGKALIQHTIERVSEISDEIIIITNEANYYLTERTVNNASIKANIHYLLEPVGKNTAPAIALSLNKIIEEFGSETDCVVFSADHLITDQNMFQSAMKTAIGEINKDKIAIFGIRPNKPETGYGYLKISDAKKFMSFPQEVIEFVEKPTKDLAEKYLTEGTYFWNSGMFCFTAKTLQNNFEMHSSDIWNQSVEIYKNSKKLKNVTTFNSDDFSSLPNVSIDYSLIEKSNDIIAVYGDFGWSDIGSWESISLETKQNDDGNSFIGESEDMIFFENSKNNYVNVQSNTKKFTAVVGVENTVVVDTPDALLILNKKYSQNVKNIIKFLNHNNFSEYVDMPPLVKKPWGTYTSLKTEKGYQIKRITVYPGQQLSLQYHFKRSEHWIVTKGEALVQIGNETFLTKAGEHRYIPINEVHRLTNNGKEELVMIEVQIGNYLGEDDIVRLEDDYEHR